MGSANEIRLKLIRALHSSVVGGHSGQRSYLRKVKSLLYWPQMKQNVLQLVRSCDLSQRNKSENVSYPGLLQPIPIPSQAWSQITMDFIEQLRISRGYGTILVIVDRLIKFGHFIPLMHPFSAKQVAIDL